TAVRGSALTHTHARPTLHRERKGCEARRMEDGAESNILARVFARCGRRTLRLITLDADHCDEGLGAGTEVLPHDPPGTMPSTNKPIRNSARANDSGKKPVVVDRSSLDRWSHDPSWTCSPFIRSPAPYTAALRQANFRKRTRHR